MRPPFSWLYHQEPLPWCGDQLNGSVILRHAYGPNRLARDETPYPPTKSWFYYFMGPSVSCWEAFYCFLGDPWAKHLKVLFIWLFLFCQLLLPSGPLAPSSHKAMYNPLLAWKTQCMNQCRGWMRGEKIKSDKYGGNGWWPLINPPSGNSNPKGTNFLGHHVIPPRCGQVETHKVQAHVRIKKN